MKYRKSFNILAPIVMFSIALSVHSAPGDGGVDEFGMEDHSATCKFDTNYQNISVADFDGDGMVTPLDIGQLSAAINDFKQNGQTGYQAFYDISNDVIDSATGVTENVLDSRDLAQANMDMMFSFFNRPSDLDKQVAAQYQFTKRYRDINQAIIDGFVPFTQEYENHGIHLLKMPQLQADGSYINVIDGKFDAEHPEGLNYDRYGNLVGVFYVLGPDMMRLMAGDREHYNDWLNGDYEKLMNETDANGNKLNDLAVMTMANGTTMIRPTGFAPDGNGVEQDNWHFHQSMCERNVWTVVNKFTNELRPKALAGTLTFQEVFDAANLMDTRQCDLDKPCNTFMSPGRKGYPDGLSIPRFFMLHTWIYNANNRCGTMWGSHEDISFNDLNPDGTLTEAEIIALRETIAAEKLSFVLQPATALLPDGTDNKNYRKVCLNTNFISQVDNYENARAILRGEDVVIDNATVNYATLGLNPADIVETLICQPKITGEPLDSRCAIHPNDVGDTGGGGKPPKK